MKKIILFILFTFLTLQTQRTISQWYQQQVPVSKPITGIKFIDSLKGWACTDYTPQYDTGYILTTTNSGTNWYVQLKASHVSFYSISRN